MRTNVKRVTGHDRGRFPHQSEPSRFGLTDRELWAEAERCWKAGWSADEVLAVLDLAEVTRG